MFEKEAKEYFENECLHSYADTEEELKEDVVAAFKEGAEFGYNKGYHEAEEHYMNVIDNQHKLVDESKREQLEYAKTIIQDLSDNSEWIADYQKGNEEMKKEAYKSAILTILKLRNCMNCKYRDAKEHSSCKDKGIVLCSHWEIKI